MKSYKLHCFFCDFCRLSTLNKFDYLMSTINTKGILNVAKFIYHASNLRKISIL